MEGNQQKMREALLAIKEVAGRDMRHHVSMSESDQASIRAWSNLFVSLVDSALAATPRNCDVGTAEEQAERMRLYCNSHGVDESRCFRCQGCPLQTADICELSWSQMLYEAEGGTK